MATQQPLFDIPIKETKKVKLDRIQVPVWTDRKANLIKEYLYLFVQITKHGTYIDGFAGPQNEHENESWSAKLVLESEPKWMRNFYLFDLKKSQYECLIKLKKCHTECDNRNIKVECGDFNYLIHKLLAKNLIGEKEATFCLLDQRSFECNWSTVEAIAKYKQKKYKIEIFYFLPIGWLNRSISALSDRDRKMCVWYGDDSWKCLLGTKSQSRADIFCDKFKKDLKYKYSHAWPIYENRGGGRIMYYMIHATDHPEAPKLMRRAYSNVVKQLSNEKQLMFWEE